MSVDDGVFGIHETMFSITAAISATPTARATASMSPDSQLMVKLDAIEDLKIELDVHKVPRFVDGIPL